MRPGARFSPGSSHVKEVAEKGSAISYRAGGLQQMGERHAKLRSILRAVRIQQGEPSY